MRVIRNSGTGVVGETASLLRSSAGAGVNTRARMFPVLVMSLSVDM